MNETLERLSILIILLTLPAASAQEILRYEIDVELSEDSAKEEISVLIFNQNYYPLNTFSYSLRADASDIRVFDEAGALSFNITRDNRIIINSAFREPLQPNASSEVMISFKISGATAKVDSGYIFSPVFSLPEATDEFRLRIRLPEGMGLTKPVQGGMGFTDVAPIPDKVYSDGKTIILEWTRFNVGGDFGLYVRYARPSERRDIVYIAALVSAVVLIAFYLRLHSRKKTTDLSEDEARVFDLVKSREGISQKEIVDITGFSKAKVSSIVSRLEDRKLIRKERKGLINKLYPINIRQRF
jgi:hypothetical protein